MKTSYCYNPHILSKLLVPDTNSSIPNTPLKLKHFISNLRMKEGDPYDLKGNRPPS